MKNNAEKKRGGLNDILVIQRINILKEVLSGLIVSEPSGRIIIYDPVSKHFIQFNHEDEVSFSSQFPINREGGLDAH